MARNERIDVRFNGTAYEVIRTRTFILSAPDTLVLDTFPTREVAEANARFFEDLYIDKARDRAGR
jgi:hypothetical protein